MRLANWEGQELGRVSRWVGERKKKKERGRGRREMREEGREDNTDTDQCNLI